MSDQRSETKTKEAIMKETLMYTGTTYVRIIRLPDKYTTIPMREPTGLGPLEHDDNRPMTSSPDFAGSAGTGFHGISTYITTSQSTCIGQDEAQRYLAKRFLVTMNSNATSTSKVPHEAIRFAIRENFPSIVEPSHALGDILKSMLTKINTLHEIASSTMGDTRGKEMTDAIDGLLDESAEVEAPFKVWHEKLNVACVMIKLVYSQQEAASGK